MKGPRPPQHLSPEMQQFWREVNAEYELETDARLTLRAACEAWDRAQSARTLIAAEGLTVDGKRHRACDIESNAYGLFLRAMRALGLDIVAPGPIGRPPGRSGVCRG